MRVIAGEFRSRRLKSLPGSNTRPTPDRLRESFFSILAPHLAGAVFVDAYAGTGSVGIEALSRGAARAIFIERSRAAVDVLRDNLTSLGLGPRSEVFTAKTLAVLERVRAGIVFLDPPYELEREYQDALALLGSRPDLLAIAQHPAKLELPPHFGRLRKFRVLRQGDNALSFFQSETAD